MTDQHTGKALADMNVEGFLGSEEERAAHRLIDQANAALKDRGGELANGFVARLFAHAAPEDLVGYEPAELAALAEQAWQFLQTRKPGSPKIRFATPETPPGGARLKGISIIEIVNDDMPFLVDSVMATLTEQNLSIRLVVHPILSVSRDMSGALAALHEERKADESSLRESFIHIHVERLDDDIRRTEAIQDLEQSLSDVRRAVADWRPMLGRVSEVITELKTNPPPLPADETAEAIQFLEWLIANNFTFLGIREHVFSPDTGSFDARVETGLGILRDRSRGTGRKLMTPEIRSVLQEPRALFITKSASRSRVHRRVFMDYVGVKRYGADGTPVGEFRILGLFTSTAYTRSTRTIPYVRRKIDNVLMRAGFNPSGHSGKALVNMLETYPRDELFQIDDETLYRFSLAILQLDERPRVRVLARRDRFDRFVYALVYLPRDRASGRVIDAIGTFLAGIYKSAVSGFTPFFPEGPLVRIEFMLARSNEQLDEPDRAALEYGVGAIVRTWSDALSEALALVHDPLKAKQLFELYSNAFSAGYRDRYAPSAAIGDIRTIEGLSSQKPLAVEFYDPTQGGADATGLKVWSYNRPIPLSERVPILENMGFRVVDETTYEVTPAAASSVWLHDMMLERVDGLPFNITQSKQALESCLLVVMRGVAENDGYNALVLEAGLWWRDVALIRTLSRYLRQIRIAFSQDYMWATLRKHPGIAAQLTRLFQVRFDPRLGALGELRSGQEDAIAAEIEAALTKVQSLDEDRIIRHFVNAIRSAIRTNFYQIDAQGQPKSLIAIKFDSRKIDDLPLPRPLYEIFVYSPRVEGVHLRFGKVARGGIRWSDRPQDFRTEILGLVKAQQVKNAVIVPVGAKGGFVPKLLPVGGTREAIAAEGVAAYSLFISTMLDITDNIAADGSVVPPNNVVRHDRDDPYFVVAADKGTATFSDIANAISLEHGFWLGDAFASGGSAGYDHKKMGITARGAWEAVRRHFREMDVNIITTPFSVAGVGDMSGDVFGNGMLLERTIRLVAAFDHRDIFIDPDPDTEKSLAERMRLFNLPRSSWQDYDKSLISKGGGIFPRSAKEIPLSPEMRALLGLKAEHATPQLVMNTILKMPVDLLWFGGIGTYVRASDETDDAAGDRANDPIRVTAKDLKCKVIGEGANLGMTQRGRIEAALAGVRLNTDAIDNSAGVNTSDVEVNIKIALSEPVRAGALSLEQRNVVLGEMTDDVAALVLRNNYLQTLALSLTQRRGLDDLGFQQRLMQTLEARDLLDRTVELLPDDMAIAERRRRSQPLTRPELAVLLAYAKLTLYGDLLDSKVPDDPYLGRELGRYFPKLLMERFPEAVERHRLRREIIATHIVNSIINRGGPSLVVRMADETGAQPDAITTAFVAVRDSYGMPELNGAIDQLDSKISGKLQLELYAAVQDLMLDRLVWFLRNADFTGGLDGVIAHYKNGIAEVETSLAAALSEEAVKAKVERAEELKAFGVPEALATRIARLPALAAATDIVLVGDRTKRALADVAATYFAARDFFRVDRIAEAAQQIATADYFDRLALDRARDGLGEATRQLTAEMLASGQAGRDAVGAWITARGENVERIRDAIHEIADTGLTLSKLSVAASLLGDLARK